jgi:hypothetical protein
MAFGWIGVDLDGTLAFYEGWKGPNEIGEPIPAMVDRVKGWIADGKDVRIFTARVSERQGAELSATRYAIQQWCQKNVGKVLPITCTKDYGMIELWDDRCVQVETNTGRVIGADTEN